MFQRLFYKLHISELIRLKLSLNKEAVNLILLILLILLGSIFFATKSFVGAQSEPLLTALDTTNPNPVTSNPIPVVTTSTTTTTSSSDTVDLSTVTPDQLVALSKSQKPLATGTPITTLNTVTKDGLGIIPINGVDSTEFVTKHADLLVHTNATFNTQITFDHIPDNSENLYSAALNPATTLSVIIEMLRAQGVVFTGNGSVVNISAVSEALKKASSDVRYKSYFLIQGIGPVLASAVRNGLLSTETTQNAYDKLIQNGFSSSSLQTESDIIDRSLTNIDPANKAVKIQLKLPDTSFDIAGAEETANNKIEVRHGGPLFFTDPSQAHQFDVGNEAFLASDYPLDTLTSNPCSSPSLPYSSVAGCSRTNLIPAISNAPTLPLLPFSIGNATGGGVGGSFHFAKSFYSEQAAIDHYHSLPLDFQKKTGDKGYMQYWDRDGHDPVTQYLAELFTTDHPKGTTADGCARDYLTHGSGCPALSYSANFIKNSYLYFNFSKIGLGYPGGFNINYHVNELTTFQELYPDVLSNFNTVTTGKLNVNINLTTPIGSQCHNSSACQGFRAEPISSDIYCYGCGEVFNKRQLGDQTASILSADPGTGNNGKQTIVKGLFSYATAGPLRFAEPSLGVDMISRSLGADHFPDVKAFYNPINLLDISNNNSFLPINTAIPKALVISCKQLLIKDSTNPDNNCNRYLNYKPQYLARNALVGGGALVSSSEPNTVYGTVYMSSDYPNNKDAIYAAFKSTGQSVDDYSDDNLQKGFGLVAYNITDISKIPLDSQVLPNETRKDYIGNKKFTGFQTPTQVALAVGSINRVTSKSCGVTEDIYSNFIPLDNQTPNPDPNYQIPDFYTSFRGYDYQPASRVQSSCASRFNVVDSKSFADPGYWSQPVKLPRINKVMTSKEPANNNIAKEMIAVYKDSYSQNGMSDGSLYFYHANVSPEDTIWQKVVKDPQTGNVTGSVNIDTKDRAQIDNNDFTVHTADFATIRPTDDLHLGGFYSYYNFEGAIAPDGTKYLLAASNNTAYSSKMVLYKWSGDYPTADDLSHRIIYDIRDFVSSTPSQVHLTSFDVNPDTGLIAFGLNLLYQGQKIKNLDGSDRADTLDYTVGAVVEQKSIDLAYPTSQNSYKTTGYNIYKFNLYEDSLRWQSPVAWLKNPTGSKPNLDPNILQVKFGKDQNLYALINYLGNLSKIQRVTRDASDQTLKLCSETDPNNPLKTRFFSRYINDGFSNPADEGKVICTSLSNPLVDESDSNFNPALSIKDPDNFEKYRGKKSLQNDVIEKDFSQLTPTTGIGTTGGGQTLRPTPDYAEELWAVPDDTNRIVGGNDIYASDGTDEALKARLFAMVQKFRNTTLKSQIDSACSIASSYKVPCALVVAIWGQESTFENSGNALGCGALQDGYKDPDPNINYDNSKVHNDLIGQFNCTAYRFGRFYNLLYPTNNRTFQNQVIKYATKFSISVDSYTPIDLRYGPDTKNGCNAGLVVRVDRGEIINRYLNNIHPAGPSCGDWNSQFPLPGSTWPVGKAIDTRPNLRTFLYGGDFLPLDKIDSVGGRIQSIIDPRISIITSVTGGTGTTPGGVGTGDISSYIHVSPTQNPHKGSNCTNARSLASDISFVDNSDPGIGTISNVVDFRSVVQSSDCFGNFAKEPLLGKKTTLPFADQYGYTGKPAYIVMHFTAGTALDIIDTGYADRDKWQEPTYHVIITKSGEIQWGQDFTNVSIHAIGPCADNIPYLPDLVGSSTISDLERSKVKSLAVNGSFITCNDVGVGISYEGSSANDIQLNQSLKLVRLLEKVYGISNDNVKGHCEVQNRYRTYGNSIIDVKNDPLFDSIQSSCPDSMNKFRNLLVHNNTVTSPPIPPTPTILPVISAAISKSQPDKKQVVLTFDAGDANSNVSTNDIVNILKRNNIKATFFVSGAFIDLDKLSQSDKLINQDSIKQVYVNGNDVYNHTYSHCNLIDRSCSSQLGTSAESDLATEFTKTDDLLSKLLSKPNVTQPYYRAPYGIENARTIQIASSKNFQSVSWTFDLQDWRASAGSGSSITKDDVWNIAKTHEIKNGDIYLMHINNKIMSQIINVNGQNMTVLDAIIQNIKSQGYSILPLSEALK